MSSSHTLQSEKLKSILKVRAKVLNATRMWFRQQDFTEVHGPTIIPAVGDWPGYFEVKYFDKKAYLTQGLQPYADFFVTSLGKIYTIAPAFRAEKLKTKRHLTEYWRIEAAVPKCDLDGIIKAQEELVTHICHSLSEEAEVELKCLRGHVEDMVKVKSPFPKLTYDEVIEMLQKDGFDIWWGQELDWEHENHLSLRFNQPFFITEFPIGIQTFFHKSHPKRSELTLSVDLLAPEGYGEIASGGQMIDEKELLLKKMEEEKINPEDQRWFIGLKRYGAIPHSGFVIGLERLIQWICKLEHVREATAFPRLSDSIYP
jgi:asparaginyl-tRNA synthetase